MYVDRRVCNVHSGSEIRNLFYELSGETSPLCCIVLQIYKYKQYIVKHDTINDFIKAYFLHCFVQRHVSAIVMSHLQVDYEGVLISP